MKKFKKDLVTQKQKQIVFEFDELDKCSSKTVDLLRSTDKENQRLYFCAEGLGIYLKDAHPIGRASVRYIKSERISDVSHEYVTQYGKYARARETFPGSLDEEAMKEIASFFKKETETQGMIDGFPEKVKDYLTHSREDRDYRCYDDLLVIIEMNKKILGWREYYLNNEDQPIQTIEFERGVYALINRTYTTTCGNTTAYLVRLAPKIKVPKKAMGNVIGKGGKTIKELSSILNKRIEVSESDYRL